MAYKKCYQCGTTELSGAGFRYCYKYQSNELCCGAMYCYTHSYNGQQCKHCGKGFLYAP